MNRDAVCSATAQVIAELKTLSDWLAAHPELGEQEYQAAERLTAILTAHGYTVERGVAGLPTAFVATYETAPGGPAVGFLAEYDALPELGHACGHRGGSTDVGNVSYVCPTIHPSIAIGDQSLKGHTREFAAAAVSEAGHRGLRRATEAMALLALDVLGDADFRSAVRRAFEEQAAPSGQ